jgi:FkbM family methyltransferase
MNLTLRVQLLNFFRKIFQLPLLEKWLAKSTNGRLPDHFLCKFAPNPYQYKRGTFRNISISGIKMRVDVSDYVGHYYFFGFRDPSQENLFALCKEHYCVLDVGANVGLTLLRFAKKASKGRVAAFEPDPVNFSYCSHNLSLNNYGNAAILNVGLGSCNAELTIELPSEGNRGGNRISPNPHGSGVKVKIRTLDSIFHELGMQHIDLIKVDVEGYELHVLKGGEKTLKKYKPILFVEVDNDHLLTQGGSAVELVAYLKELGYQSFVKASNLEPLDTHSDFAHCHFDVIVK